MFLDICGCSAFYCLQKSLKEKAEELYLRISEENDVLTQQSGDTPLSLIIKNIKRLYRINLEIIRSSINNNNNNINLNNSL